MKTPFHYRPLQSFLLVIGLLVGEQQLSLAQTPDPTSPVIPNASQALTSVIAPYRDDVRQAVLLVSQQPRILSALTEQQASSQEAFTKLIAPYGQHKQSWFYDLSRYPDVLHTLATTPAGATESTLNEIAQKLPTDSQTAALKLYHHHYDELVQVDQLNQQAEQSFDKLIAPLDDPTQQAFRQLIGLPDVLSQLTGQLDQTAQLGEAYQANPERVTRELTALHDSLTTQNQQALADYQNELNNDPQARRELQQAGRAYARANGYNTNINPDPGWTGSATTYAFTNPYPFWFGYPGWYGSPLWYPSAWWYGTGLFFGPGGSLAYLGLPSLGFSNWFFGFGYGAYPNLYNRFNTYYVRTARAYPGLARPSVGFMSAAHQAFGPTSRFNGTRTNGFSNGARVGAGVGGARVGGYRAPGWGGSTGGVRTYGGGGFHGGRH